MSGRKLDKLPSEILSSGELYQIINEIAGLVGPRTVKSKLKSGVKTQNVYELSESLSYFFRKKPSATQLTDLKNQLEKIIQTAPAVRLTLSDFPDASFCKRLAEWFRQIHPYCLIEIMVDSSIIGGVIVRSGRRIIDHSIRSQLAETENSLTGILADV